MRLTRRALLRRSAVLATASLAVLAARPGRAQAVAAGPSSITSPQPVVQPLQPVRLSLSVPGYTGPAAVVLYDARGRFAGSAEGRVEGGLGEVDILPRGALGPQWAALLASGHQVAANPAIFTLDAQTTVVAGQPRFDQFVPKARELMGNAVLDYQIDGRRHHGYRSPDSPLIWLRDHVHAARGARYFDADLRGPLDSFRDLQMPDGSLHDFLPRPYIAPKPYRTAVEADVEYLYVQGVFETWQATGDDAWARSHLGSMRRALTYSLQHPLRWDAARGLVKRPFTIDTWDFEYGATTADPDSGEPAPRHWIDDRTIWGVFHGDNTGMAMALRMLAQVEDRVGDPALAQVWRGLGDALVRNLTALAWNGRFFTHHVPFQPFDVPGVDEKEQLSLSNAYALNRGVLTEAQGQAILDEYIRRGKTTPAFAEWFSIDPPFPPGAYGLAGRTGELPGTYVNGGIMPITGGELARGAFRHGNESYGFAILDHYWQRMLSRGRTFLWYRPDGAEGVGSDQTIPWDAWGTAAMLTAMVEGAAGIEDRGPAMRDVTLSPRWPAAGVTSAYAVARYPASDAYAAYAWSQGKGFINLQASGSADRVRLRLLLPPEVKGNVRVTLNSNPTPHTVETVRASRYVTLEIADPVVNVQVRW
ncbi:MAG: hypothetical protein RLZZ387_1757 [Chloroflexota bacterium]|jgi:hypothetical protein